MKHVMRAVVLAGLVLSSCGRSERAGGAEQPRRVSYRQDFEDGKALSGPYKGRWTSNQADIARLSLDAPRGEGNVSTKALTCHASKAKTYVSCEVPLPKPYPRLEPEGWDGHISVKFYNGGFEKFYLLYLPLYPNEILFHRGYFDAKRDRWTDIDLPLDRFLYCGRRPLRDLELEYFTVVAEGPESDESFFQMDDVVMYSVPRTNPPAARPRLPLAPGVLLFQDFDDPNDFGINRFYPYTRETNAFRVTGGVDAHGRAVEKPRDAETGCLKVQLFDHGRRMNGGLRVNFPGKDTLIEFEVLVHGATRPHLRARSENRKGWYRLDLIPAPPQDEWTRCTLEASQMTFVPYQPADASAATPARDEKFWELLWEAEATGEGEHYLLLDNVRIREEMFQPDPVPAPPE